MVVDTVNLHLRQTGCDIDVQDVQGKTALHHLIQGKYNLLYIVDRIQRYHMNILALKSSE